MANLNKYRLYCNDCAQYFYVWLEEELDEPSQCTTNASHTVDTSKTTIVEVERDNEILVKEETIKTGGFYQARGLAAGVPSCIPGAWHDLVNFSWPIPISLLSAEAKCLSDHSGDKIEFLVAPGTTIGAVTQNIAASDDWIYVQQSVIDNIKVGRWIELVDGTNTDNCGRVLEIDSTNNRIKVETAAAHAFLASTPTYIKMTVKMIYDVELVEGHRLVIGESKIGGSYIPAGTTMVLRYQNNNGQAKRFAFIVEYLY